MISLIHDFHSPIKKAFLKFTPKWIEQKDLIKSSVSTVRVAGPNLSSSMSLFMHFCVEVESDVVDFMH